MKTQHCDECKHFNDEDVPGARVCEKNHKPRWYSPKGTLDQNYGWKRKCDDFRPTGHNAEVTGVPGFSGESVLDAGVGVAVPPVPTFERK